MKSKFEKQAGASPILIVIIIVVTLAIGAVGWYVFTRDSDDNSDNNQTEEQQATVIEGDMFKAASQGQALECDWELNYDEPAQLTEGKFYTDGVNGRSEASYEYEDQTYQAIAIINEDRTYHWSEPIRGTKVQGISDDRAEYEAREPKYDLLDTSIDVNFNVDYIFTCQPWTVDESIFTPPTDVKFLFL